LAYIPNTEHHSVGLDELKEAHSVIHGQQAFVVLNKNILSVFENQNVNSLLESVNIQTMGSINVPELWANYHCF